MSSRIAPATMTSVQPRRVRQSPRLKRNPVVLGNRSGTGYAELVSPARRSAPPRPKRVDVPPPDALQPTHDLAGEVPLLGNDQLARVFYEIADMLEIQGELSFKVAAYRRAADSIAAAQIDVARAYREGEPPHLPGVGRAIDEKLAELAATGQLEYHARLRAEVPPSVVTLLQVPGLGPGTAGELWRQANIGSLEQLEAALGEGRIRGLRGMSVKTEQRLRDGLASLKSRPPRRMRLSEARTAIERVRPIVASVPGVHEVVPAGSYRRGRATVADIDLLVETEDPAAVIERVHDSALVERVGGHGARTGGATRTTVQLVRGPQVDLMTMPPGAAGTYLVHFTGSAEHNVRLREMARERGWSLSEHGFTSLDDPAQRLTFATEQEVYEFLGLPFIPPALREDRGEIEAALSGILPELVTRGDLRGDAHTHSDWSDGHQPIERVTEAARVAGLSYQVLTDHSQSLVIAHGLSPARVEQERRVIGALNEKFAREGTDFRLLHGCELEIRTDGRLDYEDALLASFDVVVASLHVGRRQPREQLMARYRVALRNPNVDIIAHPSGRKIGLRDDLDLDWDAFYREAAETRTVLEVNGSDERLDLEPRRARAALQAGNRFVIDSDTHYLHEFENLEWGVAQARRAWLTAADVLNSLPLDQFVAAVTDHG